MTLERHPAPAAPPAGNNTAAAPACIKLVNYSDRLFHDAELAALTEAAPYIAPGTVTWIHAHGSLDPEQLQALGAQLDLHALTLEDVLNRGERPKVESYNRQLFVIMSYPTMNDGSVVMEQISIYAGENFVLSFYSGGTDPFDLVRKRLRNPAGRLRAPRVDYLLYGLLDVIVDQGYPVLEIFGERLDDIEDQLLAEARPTTMGDVHRVRRDLLLLRRMLWPHRDVINSLIRDEHPLIARDTKPYLRDCYDHTVQIMDLIETYREMTGDMLEVHLASVSNRLNDIMRVLTIITTIFIPLSFIAGVYGMNFGARSNSPWAMPELDWYFGYPLAWLVMIAVAIGMVIYFKRKKWL